MPKIKLETSICLHDAPPLPAPQTISPVAAIITSPGTGEGKGDGDGDGTGVGLTEGDGAGDGDIDGLGAGDGLGDGDGLGVGVGVGIGDGDGVGVGDPELNSITSSGFKVDSLLAKLMAVELEVVIAKLKTPFPLTADVTSTFFQVPGAIGPEEPITVAENGGWLLKFSVVSDQELSALLTSKPVP